MRYTIEAIEGHPGCYAGIYDHTTNSFIALVCEGADAVVICAALNAAV